MTILSNNERLDMLVESIKLLAAEYEIQTSVLPDFVHIPDEVCLIFSDNYLFVEELFNNGILTEYQRNKLCAIDALLDEMSNNKSLWTLESLKQSNEWRKIRCLAEDILKLLGKEKQKPDLYWVKYQK